MPIVTTDYWWTITTRGVVAVLFGIAAIGWSDITLQTLMMLFGVFTLLDGLVNLSIATRASKVHGRWWEMLIQGIVGVGVGIVSFAWPAITAVALLYIVAFWAIAVGVLEMAASIRFGMEIGGGWLLAVCGIWSALFGVFLLMWPNAALHGFIWFIGTVAILFGSLLVFFGLKLRRIGFELIHNDF